MPPLAEPGLERRFRMAAKATTTLRCVSDGDCDQVLHLCGERSGGERLAAEFMKRI